MTDEVHAMANGTSGSGLGSGGMTSKLQAAGIAERAGIVLAIVNGTHERPLARAVGCGVVWLVASSFQRKWLTVAAAGAVSRPS